MLAERDYQSESADEPLLGRDDESVLARLVANGACLTAIHPEEGQIDLLTSIAGFTFAELDSDATPFGRVLYFSGYTNAVERRLPGFFIQAMACVLLLIGAIAGIVMRS